jgi:hypothetical protein
MPLRLIDQFDLLMVLQLQRLARRWDARKRLGVDTARTDEACRAHVNEACQACVGRLEELTLLLAWKAVDRIFELDALQTMLRMERNRLCRSQNG